MTAPWLETLLERDLTLKAFVAGSVDPERVRADEARLAAPGSLPLAGTRFAAKDLFHVDGLPTTAGTALPAGVLAGPQASAVTRLQLAGSLLVGKTKMDQLAFCPPPDTTHPRDAGRRPGGSSSGSAAAVGAGLLDLALGTQTLQSVILPAAYCGVVGLKPTFGRIPTDGVVPLAPSFDTVGLLAKDVATATRGAAILIDTWRERGSGGNAVLGLPTGRYAAKPWQEPAGLAPYDAAIRRLEARGFAVVRVDLDAILDLEAARDAAIRLFQVELAATLEPLRQRFESLLHAETLLGLSHARQVPPAAWVGLKETQRATRQKLADAMSSHGIDAWVTPSVCGSAPLQGVMGAAGRNTLLWSFAGLPCLGLPAGAHADGFPAGLQLIGAPDGDEALLALGAAVEGAFA